MNDSDRAGFGRVLAMLTETYREDISDLSSEAYWLTLRRFTLAEVERGAERLMGEPGRRFMPRPGEIVEAVEGRDADQAELALLRVERAMEFVGPYETVTFDPVLNGVIQALGGWVYVCNWTRLPPAEYRYRQMDFRRLFTLYMRSAAKIFNPPTFLPGIIHTQNALGREGWSRGDGTWTPHVLEIGADGGVTQRRALPPMTKALPEHEGEDTETIPVGPGPPVELRALLSKLPRQKPMEAAGSPSDSEWPSWMRKQVGGSALDQYNAPTTPDA